MWVLSGPLRYLDRLALGWEAAFIIIGVIGFLWIISDLVVCKPEKTKRYLTAELTYINSDKENEIRISC